MHGYIKIRRSFRLCAIVFAVVSVGGCKWCVRSRRCQHHEKGLITGVPFDKVYSQTILEYICMTFLFFFLRKFYVTRAQVMLKDRRFEILV